LLVDHDASSDVFGFFAVGTDTIAGKGEYDKASRRDVTTDGAELIRRT
jgi:hypothetical protein